MPSPFDITTSTNTLTLDNNRSGVAVFTVKNLTRRSVHVTAEAKIDPPTGTKWLTFLPLAAAATTNAPNARDIPVDGDTIFQIQIAVPADATPGSFKLKLKVADESNPDDNFSESPDVVFTVREIPKPQPRPFPIWIIPAIVIVLVVIVAIIIVAVTSSNNQHVHETETAIAMAGLAADAQTATAAALTQEATQAALAANMTATQAAVFGLQTSIADTSNSNKTLSAVIQMTAAQNTALAQTAAAQTRAAQTAAAQTRAAQTAAAQTAAAQTAVAQTIAAQTHTVQTAVAVQTQTALNVFVGDWVTTVDGDWFIATFSITDSGSNRVDLVAVSSCASTSLCQTATPAPFKVTNIPFTPGQILVGSNGFSMLIRPINNGQLLVTFKFINNAPFDVIYRRKTRLDRITIGNAVQISPNIPLSQVQINQLVHSTPTKAP